MFRSQQSTPSVKMDQTSRRSHVPIKTSPAVHVLLSLQRGIGNAAVSALVNRAIPPTFVQREPAPANDILEPEKGPQARARDDINNALLIASNWLAVAIRNRDNNAAIPTHIFRAFKRFFGDTDVVMLDLLKTRIDDAQQWISGIPFDVISNPVPPGYRDAQLHQAGLGMAGLLAAAVQPGMGTSGDIYVAIYPPWFAADPNKRAAVLLHELFHFFPGVKHGQAGALEAPWENARAYQGFVTVAAGLPELPGITAMFP